MISRIFSFISFIFISSYLPSAATYQCIDDNAKCPGNCCNFKDPYLLLVGPTCSIQAFWFSSDNRTVWPFPTFRFGYHWDQESNGSIMGTPESKPEKQATTKVLTMHPSWDSHANEENNSGVFFSLFNVHMSCIFSTFIFCLCIMVSVLLAYLGYWQFCHRPKRKSREATSTSHPAPLTSRSWASTMEDKYEMDDYGGSSMYEFAPQGYGKQQPNYAPPQPCYAPQRPRYDNRQCYNGGQFVDPVEQLRLLLQAVPIANANAPIQPALIYQAANQVAQVHHPAPPAAPPLNLGAAANNANAAAAAAATAAAANL
jgi:hypothetical protein